ncbi:hypothetical protein HMPREF1039_0630 [Megasphaera lornae]|uniref:Uncharacterized protein n=1 Tax=Megasphaera lornae TaxID=1000568 RepID=A0ABN0D049_9FIRM|nr:hypothetical protein HMPREF1039_0630 [Megasphaera lornae]
MAENIYNYLACLIVKRNKISCSESNLTQFYDIKAYKI